MGKNILKQLDKLFPKQELLAVGLWYEHVQDHYPDEYLDMTKDLQSTKAWKKA